MIDETPSWGTLLKRTAGGLVGLILVGAALGASLKEPLTATSAAFVSGYGLGGITVGVFFTDTFPFLSHLPFLFFGYNGGLGLVAVWGAAAIGSFAAGASGWAVGRLWGRTALAQRWFERSKVGPMVRRHGRNAVIFGALGPFPYALFTQAAGAAGVPLSAVMIGACARAPKVALHLTMVVLGWKLGVG